MQFSDPMPGAPQWAASVAGACLVHHMGWEATLRQHVAPYQVIWRSGICAPMFDQAVQTAEHVRAQLADGSYW